MQLQQVQCIYGEVLQAALDESSQICNPIPRRGMRIQAAAGFGSDDDFLAAIALESGQQALTASIAINVSSIKEINAEIDCPVERRQRLAILNLAPHAADGPGA